MALYWKILAPLAVVWFILAGSVHWLWAPRAIAQEEMQYRDRVAGSLERLARELAPLLKEGRGAAVAPLLDEALRANPSWTALELRDRGGQSVRRTDAVERRGAPAADERAFEQPVIDGAVVLGWLTARVDLGPGFGAIRAGQRQISLLLLAGLAAALAATAFAVRWFVSWPLERISDAAGMMAEGGTAHLPGAGGDAVGRLAANVTRLGDALGERDRAIEREQDRRRAAEERLRESEERYTLAVRGADDGLWEWDLGSDRVYYSPRWKSMLGFTEDEIGDSVEEWRSRIHPDDLEPSLAALQAHLDGATARFENDHRLRHKNGRYRWVLARGATLRSAVGKPYRLVGLNTDITARKRAEEVLMSLAEGLAAARGDAFFRHPGEKLRSGSPRRVCVHHRVRELSDDAGTSACRVEERRTGRGVRVRPCGYAVPRDREPRAGLRLHARRRRHLSARGGIRKLPRHPDLRQRGPRDRAPRLLRQRTDAGGPARAIDLLALRGSRRGRDGAQGARAAAADGAGPGLGIVGEAIATQRPP